MVVTQKQHAKESDYKAPMPSPRDTRCPYPLLAHEGKHGHWVGGKFVICSKAICSRLAGVLK